VLSRDLEVASELLRRFRGFTVSRRDGLVVVKLDVCGETWLVWVRGSPVTQSALDLFERVARRHRYDRAVLLKTRDVADYVTYGELRSRGLEVARLEELLKQTSC